MMKFKTVVCLLVALLSVCPLMARDVILEFKGAYFLATDSDFKDIYGNGSALYGPELTIQFCDDKPWYAFASFDYLHKKGHSVGLCDETSVTLLPLALGLKYVRQTCKRADVYAGLGFEAMNVRTKNCSEFVESRLSQWGFGGIAKVGAYYHLPCNFLIDIFIDYSFMRVGSNDCSCLDATGVELVKANVSGAIFGAALGYNF